MAPNPGWKLRYPFAGIRCFHNGFYKPTMEFQTHHANCDSQSWELDTSRMGSTMGIDTHFWDLGTSTMGFYKREISNPLREL